jgi:FkbM family methyltransferase
MNAVGATVWPTGRPWIGQLTRLANGMPIEVDPLDMVGKHILVHGCYEPETFEFLRSHLRPGMVFFDVGAHVGQYTLLASEGVGAQGSVHAFEPHPVTFAALRRNVERIRAANVTLNDAAVTDRSGTRRLHLGPSGNPGGSSLFADVVAAAGSIEVRTVTLDDYARGSRLPRVDVMKLDIEGGELTALLGAVDVLRGNPDAVLIIEFNEAVRRAGQTLEDLEGLLTSLGLQLFRLWPGRLEPYRTSQARAGCNNVVAMRHRSVLNNTRA